MFDGVKALFEVRDYDQKAVLAFTGGALIEMGNRLASAIDALAVELKRSNDADEDANAAQTVIKDIARFIKEHEDGNDPSD